MTLHIILDEEFLKYVTEDENKIYLINDGLACEKKDNIFIISDINLDEKKIFEWSQEVKNIFKQIGYYKHVNNFFTNTILPLYRVFNAIDFCMAKYNIEDIILHGGSEKIEFIPYYMAEGEAQTKFFYKSSWYMNYFINHKYAPSVCVDIQNETSILKIKSAIFIRRYILLIYKFFFILKRLIHMQIKIRHEYPIVNSSKKIIVFPVRSIAQITSIEKLYKTLEKDYVPMFISYERLLDKNYESYKYLIQQNYRFLHLSQVRKVELINITIKSFLITLWKALKNTERKKFKYFKKHKILSEVILLDFEKNIYNALLSRALLKYKNKLEYLFSTEIQSPEAFIENQIAKEMNIPSCNTQAQSMMKIPISEFDMHGNYFLFENKIDYNFFINFDYQEKYKMKYLGSFKNFDLIKKDTRLEYDLDNILYLTQNHEHSNQIEIIKKLLEVLPEEKKIFLKLHPRDSFDYSKILSDRLLIENEKNINIVMRRYDIIVSRTTSLLLDALLYNKLVFSILFSSFDRSGKQVYINEKYLKIINGMDELINFDQYANDEIKNKSIKRNTLIKDLYGNTDFEINFKDILND